MGKNNRGPKGEEGATRANKGWGGEKKVREKESQILYVAKGEDKKRSQGEKRRYGEPKAVN